jgi:hypothetical protein
MAFLSPAEQRDILSLSFEPTEDGYVYYHNRWSRGIPVTKEERNEYLNIPVLGSRRAWCKSLEGRETLPSRAYKPVARKLYSAMPLSMGAFVLILGLLLLLSGLNESNVVLAIIYVAGGSGMLVFGGFIIVQRLRRLGPKVR